MMQIFRVIPSVMMFRGEDTWSPMNLPFDDKECGGIGLNRILGII